MSDFKTSELRDTSQELQELREQLAASQAREQQLREALGGVCRWFQAVSHDNLLLDWQREARKAIALPSDTTALESMVQKAGEVMRERAARGAEKEAVQIVVDGREERAYNNAVADCANAIRALPGVTLDDLKGGAA